MVTQTNIGADLRNFEGATTECKTCGATAHISPDLYEDGRSRNEEGEVGLLEMKCENNHRFSHLVNHPESDLN